MLLVSIVSGIGAALPARQVAALPTPIPRASQTLPPDAAAPSPTPLPLRFSGQVIDFERGFLVFASGDALRLAAGAPIVDDRSGTKPAFRLDPGFYALVKIDPASSRVASVRVSQRSIPGGLPAAQIPRQYVVQASSPVPNPDLAPKKSAYGSKLSADVLVSVTVQVPPETPYTDDVYIATDTSGWNARAIRLQRVDGLHFKIDIRLRGGTDFHYLFTRGSWRSVERDRAGLERKARDFYVPGGDAQTIDNTVYRWADLR
ncbi:MAG: hypothetical protein M3T49_02585 [Candidatus Eremiobacteraeota bacterium]|nr:hypothetical protein [Candidatus Eremiobacteraeota bacterium]